MSNLMYRVIIYLFRIHLSALLLFLPHFSSSYIYLSSRTLTAGTEWSRFLRGSQLGSTSTIFPGGGGVMWVGVHVHSRVLLSVQAFLPVVILFVASRPFPPPSLHSPPVFSVILKSVTLIVIVAAFRGVIHTGSAGLYACVPVMCALMCALIRNHSSFFIVSKR